RAHLRRRRPAPRSERVRGWRRVRNITPRCWPRGVRWRDGEGEFGVFVGPALPLSRRLRLAAGAASLMIAALLVAGAARAATHVVNFDDLAPGTTVSSQYASSVTFNQPTTGGFAPVVRAASGLAHSAPNVADIYTCPNPSGCGEFVQTSTRGDLTT